MIHAFHRTSSLETSFIQRIWPQRLADVDPTRLVGSAVWPVTMRKGKRICQKPAYAYLSELRRPNLPVTDFKEHTEHEQVKANRIEHEKHPHSSMSQN